MRAFDWAIEIILELEGLHADRPPSEDPGGDTWYGLARRWHPDMPWPPTKDQAIAEYHRAYWQPTRCHTMFPAMALAVFDAAVQHAPEDAIRFLQAALGLVADGHFGPVTAAAVTAVTAEEDEAVALETLARRLVYYPGLDNWASNGLGWTRRVLAIEHSILVRPPISP